jgi:hypothetical protein
MDLEYAFNLGEAGLWFAFSAVMLIKAWRLQNKLREIFASLCAAFFFFGISDLIEAHTGAWWTPLWLLLWKTVCLAWLLFDFFRYRKATKISPAKAV